MQKFTVQQIANFKKYQAVQRTNRYNMFDMRARNATGMDRDEYIFVMENYEALEKAAKEKS